MIDPVALCWILVTVFCCGGWMGWFAGRRHEKTRAAMHRMRKRRPVRVTINVDFDTAAAAVRSCGYEIVRPDEVLH